MVKEIGSRYNEFILPGLFVVLALAIWLVVMFEFRLDDSFITYRYARNLAGGWGLVYNAGDAVLSTTAPLYAMLLAGISLVVPDFPAIGGLLGTLSIGLGGWLICRLTPREFWPPLRLWAGLVYVLSSPLWLALGMETPLWIMLVLASLWLAQTERWRAAGLWLGIAVLVRPDAALLGLLLGLSAIGIIINRSSTRRRWWLPVVSYATAAAAPLVIFAVWAWLTYGSPFPATLSAKGAQAAVGITGLGAYVSTWEGLRLILRSLVSQSSLYVVFGLLMLFGLAGRTAMPVMLVVAWGVLHLLAYIVLGVAPYRWYYAPLVPGAILLAASGLHYMQQRLEMRRLSPARYLVLSIAVFPLVAQITSFNRIDQVMAEGAPPDAMLPIVDWQAYREVGDWLRTQTSDDATVGVAEVGQVGFYAERWMTDYLGLLQPEVAGMVRRGDLYSWLAGYAPDYLVFQRFRGAPLVLYNYLIGNDPWFTSSYRAVTEFDDSRYAAGPVTIFERTTPDRPVMARSVQLDFDGLRLVGIATDGYDLPTVGGPIRVRLDWEMISELPRDLHIAVKGVNMPGNPGFDGGYVTEHWQGSFSTWHGFVVPSGLAPGGYPLQVAVGPTGGPYNVQNSGWFDVSFPRQPAADGLLFASESGDAFRLLDADLVLDKGQLITRWDWRAERDLTEDHVLFVHVVRAGESAPLAQADQEPLTGTYPTHLWQVGEVVPVEVIVENLPTDPGRYDILVGWYRMIDGVRLTLNTGADSLLAGTVVVGTDGSAIIARVSD